VIQKPPAVFTFLIITKQYSIGQGTLYSYNDDLGNNDMFLGCQMPVSLFCYVFVYSSFLWQRKHIHRLKASLLLLSFQEEYETKPCVYVYILLHNIT